MAISSTGHWFALRSGSIVGWFGFQASHNGITGGVHPIADQLLISFQASHNSIICGSSRWGFESFNIFPCSCDLSGCFGGYLPFPPPWHQVKRLVFPLLEAKLITKHIPSRKPNKPRLVSGCYQQREPAGPLSSYFLETYREIRQAGPLDSVPQLNPYSSFFLKSNHW